VDSTVGVRAYGVVCYGIAAGLVEVDSMAFVRDGVVSYDVVAGRFEVDSIVVVRGVYILYSTVIRVVEVNSSFPIASSPGHGESAYVNVICRDIEDVVIGIESFYNRVRGVLGV